MAFTREAPGSDAEISRTARERLGRNRAGATRGLHRPTGKVEQQSTGLMASPGFALTGATPNEVWQIDADHFDALRKRIIDCIVSQIPNENQRLADRRRTLTRNGHLPRREL